MATKMHSLRVLSISTIVLLTCCALLFVQLNQTYMRPDEWLSYNTTQHSFSEALHIIQFRDIHAPLWFIEFWGWQRLAGTSEFAGRISSLLLGMLTLAGIIRLGRLWFGSYVAGWVAALILAMNALFTIYALEIRPYPLALWTATLLMWAFHRWMVRGTYQTARIYALVAALSMYVHYFLAFLIVAQVIYFALRQVMNWQWQRIQQGLFVAALALVIMLPQLLTFYFFQRDGIGFGTETTVGTPTEPTNLASILELFNLATNGWWWVYGLVWLLGLLVSWRRQGYWEALLWLFGVPIIVFGVNSVFRFYNVRYISFIAPATGLLCGAVIAGIIHNKRIPFRQVIGGTLAIGLFALSAYTQADTMPERAPWRAILQSMAADYQIGDVVLLVEDEATDAFVLDQMTRYLPPELVASATESLAVAADARRVWFFSTSFLETRARERQAILEDTHRVWSVADGSGCHSAWCLVSQLMLAPPVREPTVFGEILAFYGADIDAITTNSFSVILWWEAVITPTEDYSISLRLVDDTGFIISQVDRPIDAPGDDIGEIQTTQMIPEGSYIDERVLTLPPNSTGIYTLELVVYQWWDGVRLLTDTGVDSLAITQVTVP